MTDSLFIWLLVAAIGLVFGSFATLVSHRLVAGGGMVAARSRCPTCGTPLGVRDLVPVFSWAFSRGTCRHCHTAVHWRYPVIETATALAFLLVYWRAGPSAAGAVLALFALCLIIMTTVDFEHRILPDETQLATAALGILFHLALLHTPLVDILAGMLAGLFLGTALQKGYRWLRGRDGLGTGDVKFLCVAGIWLGAPGLAPLMLLSGVLGVLTALAWRMRGQGEYFPFGPALAAATFALVLFPELAAVFWRQGG